MDDTLGEIKARAGSDLGLCVVVNDANIVLGLLREEELSGSDETRAEDAMQSGPSTFRPHVAIAEMARYMEEHDMDNAPITTSEGKLMGVLFKADADRIANESG